MRSFALIFARIAISTASQNLGRATVSSMYMRNSQEFWANLAYGALLGFASNAQVSASMWCRRRVGFKWRQHLIAGSLDLRLIEQAPPNSHKNAATYAARLHTRHMLVELCPMHARWMLLLLTRRGHGVTATVRESIAPTV